MENQTLRELVFDVLFNYVREYDGIYTESDCATVRDEIYLRIDQSQFTADEAEEHINQEVEKRIAERMPSEEDAQNAESRYEDEQNEDKLRFNTEYCFRDYMNGWEDCRSRLTNP